MPSPSKRWRRKFCLNKLHFQALRSETFRDFVEKRTRETEVLKRGSAKERQNFWIAKCIWIEMEESQGDWLLRLEEARIANARVMHEFLKKFGDVYVSLKEQIMRVELLERRVMLKETAPNTTREQLDSQLEAIEEKEREKFEKLEYEAKIAPLIVELEATGQVDMETRNQYRKELKRVLRELYRTLHPESLVHKPEFERLTDEQRMHLKDLWHRSMEVREQELRQPQGAFGWELPALDKLLDILATAKSILAHAGLVVNTAYVIQGETIGERTEWLENRIRISKETIRKIKADIIALRKDKDVLEKKAILEAPSEHDDIRADMVRKTEEHARRGDRLENRLNELFDKEAA